jgi:hypothetical protein
MEDGGGGWLTAAQLLHEQQKKTEQHERICTHAFHQTIYAQDEQRLEKARQERGAPYLVLQNEGAERHASDPRLQYFRPQQSLQAYLCGQSPPVTVPSNLSSK